MNLAFLSAMRPKAAVHAMSGRHERELGCRRVYQQHVGIAVFPELQRLSGSDRDHLNGDVMLRLELRQDDAQKPGVLGAGRRGQAQVPRSGTAEKAREQGGAEQSSMQCAQGVDSAQPARYSETVISLGRGRLERAGCSGSG